MAESEGFEPPIDLRLCLISSQVHSTELCHLSIYYQQLAGGLQVAKSLVSVVVPVSIQATATNLSTAAALCAGARCE